MAESFICLMADLDEGVQKNMSSWYEALQKEGFTGKQTPNLPYHISLATYPLEMEDKVVENIKKAAAEFSQVQVHLSHMGMFAGGSVLFAAPERNPELDKLQEACQMGVPQPYPFTPHTTILIDEPEVVQAAIPTFVKCFKPMVGKVVRLHLCAFWPTREIASLELKDD
ncbi:MAG: 2'-5' RNA ligase family protein [Clostridiales bacterium]|nr:2'-5' RNA ligase family protein [Clostridiales bacterium]